MKTIISITLEVEHEDTANPAHVTSRVVRVVSNVLNGLSFEDGLLADVLMHRTRIISSSHKKEEVA